MRQGPIARPAFSDRIFPRGALILSVLSLGYFATGIVRNRVFANTFGAGSELDAYYAAFRLPEIALDVLVAAGLTAPFVPDLHEPAARRRGRREPVRPDRPDRSHRASWPSPARSSSCSRPWIGDRLEGFDPATRALYVDLLRINCLAQVLFAASFALGEILVANRRFLAYALAPILYIGRDRRGDGPVRRPIRDRGHGLGRRGRRRGPPGGPVRRDAPDRVPRSARGSRSGSPAFREFIRLMLPRMASHPVELLMLTWFTILATRIGAGQRDVPELRPRLPGRPDPAGRRAVLAGRLPDPVSGLRRPGRPDVPGRARPEPGDRRDPHGPRRRRALRPLRHAGRGPAGWWPVRPRGRGA